jgi:transcriptional regulator with XRE-family HTH domain
MSGDDQMPPEPPLLPEQRVGMAMREAREVAEISLRQMAGKLGYRSHTTLSSYERGAVMPTDEVVTGYERVLGLTPSTLANVLEAARIERHGDAWAKRRVHIPTEFVTNQSVRTGQPDDPAAPSHRARWRGRWVVIAGGVVVLVVVGVVVGLVASQPPTSAQTAASVSGVEDGMDPSVTGCAADAVTMDSVSVYDPPEHLVGTLELRSSPRCGTSWPRFVPTTALATTPTITLELDVYRPADGGMAKYRVTYDGLAAYGNMLISAHQCVYAQMTLTRQGLPSLPPVQTGCRMSPGS